MFTVMPNHAKLTMKRIYNQGNSVYVAQGARKEQSWSCATPVIGRTSWRLDESKAFVKIQIAQGISYQLTLKLKNFGSSQYLDG